jgi:PPE-repeat protein
MDFAALPPEVNSGRMYAGAGSGPMLAAAVAWQGLAVELNSAARSYAAVVADLTDTAWLGSASVSMAAAVAPYVAWMSTTAEQAAHSAVQARSAVAAYEAAFVATVPPPVIAQNRALLMSLVATNVLGQNTPAIAATETHYAEMWAQDVTAMYGYASGSAAATTLTPFTVPPQNTNPAGVGAQVAAVGQATGTSAAAPSSSVLSQLVSAVPTLLQELASADPSGSSMASILGGSADWLDFGSGFTFVTSGVLFLLAPFLNPIGAGALPITSLGAAGLSGGGTPGALSLGSAGTLAGLGRTEVSAGLGRAASIGGLSVPQTWTWAAPETAREAMTLPEPTLVGLPQAEVDGLEPGYGGMLPGSLMAAAAGGGGAAGGSWAGQRAGGTQPRAGATSSRAAPRPALMPRPALIPQLARESGLPEATHGLAMWPDQRVQRGEGPPRENLRAEIDDLRRKIAGLAIERDVLMRSLAMLSTTDHYHHEDRPDDD